MVQQHFSLVPAMTVAENVALGLGACFHPVRAAEQVRALSRETSLQVDPHARAGDLAVAAQQKVELLKAIARNARILVLDEPTAVLAPSETHELKAFIGRLASEGVSVVLITHKLHDALHVADHVTVLRRGRTVHTVATNDVGEAELARMMFPEGVPAEIRADHARAVGDVVAEVRDVEVRDATGITRLRSATLSVRAGEVVGVAGAEGSGYHELLLALGGRIVPVQGAVRIPDAIAFIPEDRQRDAIVGHLTLVENVALKNVGTKRGRVAWRTLARRTHELIREHGVQAAGHEMPARFLSGGNQQKLVLARELDGLPSLVVAENPTQGLDVRATAAIRARLLEARARGAGVVMYSSDLDELVAVADRVVVTFEGSLRDVPRDTEAVGRAMLGA